MYDSAAVPVATYASWDPWVLITTFINTPAPFSPFTEYLVVLFLLWLLARRDHRKADLHRQAQAVLHDKYESGELSKDFYERFRDDVPVR
jgi:hypothetical protein